MGFHDYRFRSDLALRHQAIGEARGTARAVLKLCAARGVLVSDEVRERVLACEDMSVLDEWLRRAARSASAQEIFG